jgi:hypothetical protein
LEASDFTHNCIHRKAKAKEWAEERRKERAEMRTTDRVERKAISQDPGGLRQWG